MKEYLLVLTTFFTLTVVHSQQGWKYQNSNLTYNQYGTICPINKDTVYAIADSGKFLKTYNGGTNWITQNTGFTVLFYDLSFCNFDTGYAVGQNGTIIKTINGGTNWNPLSSGTNKNLYSISTKTPNNLWTVGDSGVILNSHDYGTTWIKNDTLTKKLLNSIRFRNSNIGFIAGNSGTLLKTVDGGINWDTLTIATTKDLFSLTVTDNYAYLLAGTVDYYSFYGCYEFFKTNDDINWAGSNLSVSVFAVSGLHFLNDSIGFALEAGCPTCFCPCIINIYKTTDYGQNWAYSLQGSSSSTPNYGYSDIAFITDSVGYAFSGNNIIKTNDGGTYTFVGIKELNDNQYLKISPNPFSTQTTLQTDNLLKNATLSIYNSFGQQVKQIKNISEQTITLHRNNLPSGLYFIHMTQDNKTITTDKLVITDN